MISITFKNGTNVTVPAKLEKKREEIIIRVNNVKDQLMRELAERIKEKLSGELLTTRSGQLKSSVHIERTEPLGNKIVGRIVAGTGLGVYPEVQEYGGTKQYEILPRNKRALAFFMETSGVVTVRRLAQGGGATYRGSQGQGLYHLGFKNLYFKTGKKGGSLKSGSFGEFTRLGGVVVKRVVHPPLPERSFMRSSLAEMQQRMVEEIRATIARTVSE